MVVLVAFVQVPAWPFGWSQKLVLEGCLLLGIADPREKAKLLSKKWMILVYVSSLS